MITDKELKLVNLSATNKDFQGIWTELLDISKKLSERWDPTSTNEADPGIILLKVLTAMADKLNYNIDKNILEAFMPSAAQRESMQKLCMMLGYNMKYYRSAETEVTITFNGTKKEFSDLLGTQYDSLYLPAFTNITTVDKDINYVTTESVYITPNNRTVKVNCIQGQLAEVKTDNSNGAVTATELFNYRYYLPETQIAENGIYIYNVGAGITMSTANFWTRVDNLNIASAENRRIFKLGYSSVQARPYIEFAEDVENYIDDGLIIKYIRTSADNGNISAKTLNTITLPTEGAWSQFSADNFTVLNLDSATNGSGVETIEQAYNSFKKTVGTFETLVTCRDYMNKIYQLTDDLENPLVSNIIVSDIRDDINRAVTLCEFENNGIVYVDKSLNKTSELITTLRQFINNIDTSTVQTITGSGVGVDTAKSFLQEKLNEPQLDHFDLMLYPFKTIYTNFSKTNYKKSFTYSSENNNLIIAKLADLKTIAHQYQSPYDDEIVCIKNYLKLDAKITTTTKINDAEQLVILNNIYTALYTKFNSRELDFGEEIPFDSIYNCIVDADPAIKTVSLDEPTLYTKLVLANGTELAVAAPTTQALDATSATINYYVNKLILRNVLAGRISLFNYFTDFKSDLSEKSLGTAYTTLEKPYLSMYPALSEPNSQLTQIKPKLTIENITSISEWSQEDDVVQSETIANNGDGLVLRDNELIQFRAPSLKTVSTFPAYVNYYFHLQAEDGSTANDFNTKIPANAEYQLKEGQYLFINYTTTKTDDNTGEQSDYVVNKKYEKGTIVKVTLENDNYVYDSNLWHEGVDSTQTGADGNAISSHKWAKVDGFDKNLFKINGTSIGGMFSVGANDTIEIREPVQVDLKPKDDDGDSKNILIYWEISSDRHLGDHSNVDNDTDNLYTFLTNDSSNQEGAPAKYILGPGEYFYYTDESMLNVAYYGQGSEIEIISTDASILTLQKQRNQQLDFEKIQDEGYSAIPWITKTVSKNTFIRIKEYQYVNLASEDKLLGIKFTENGVTDLDDQWKQVEAASYQFSLAEASSMLPKLYYQIDNDEACWEASTRLSINIGPKTAQKLNSYTISPISTSSSDIKVQDSITLTIGNGAGPATGDGLEIKSVVGATPLSIKANYIVVSTNTEINTKVSKYNSASGKYEEVNDFKLRLFEQKDVYYTDENNDNPIKADLNTFNDYWSDIQLDKTNGKNKLHCYIDLPSENTDKLENYGLLLVYYDVDKAEIGDTASYVKVKIVQDEDTDSSDTQGDN